MELVKIVLMIQSFIGALMSVSISQNLAKENAGKGGL